MQKGLITINKQNAEDLHLKILTIKKDLKTGYIEFAKLLYEAKENQYYKLLGYDSFKDYVECSEISISYGTSRKLIDIYQYVLKPLIREGWSPETILPNIVEWSKLVPLLPPIRKLKDAKDIKDLLFKYEDNTKRQIQKLLKTDKKDNPVLFDSSEDFILAVDEFIESIKISIYRINKVIDLWKFNIPEGTLKIKKLMATNEKKGVADLISFLKILRDLC